MSIPCPNCGGAPSSMAPASDGQTWAVCGSCGFSYVVPGAGAAPQGFIAAPKPPSRGVGKKGCFGCLMFGPGSLGLFIPMAVLFCPKMCATLDESHRVAMEELKGCARAREVLGEDLDAAWVGTSSGESSSGVNSGSASWSLTVSGSRGRGDYSFSAQKDVNGWHVTSATLIANGETISIPHGCGGTAGVGTGFGGGGDVGVGGFGGGVPPPTTGGTSPSVAGACDRLDRCCDVAGHGQAMEAICRSAPLVRGQPNGDQTCSQLLDSANQLLSLAGTPPPECRP